MKTLRMALVQMLMVWAASGEVNGVLMENIHTVSGRTTAGLEAEVADRRDEAVAVPVLLVQSVDMVVAGSDGSVSLVRLVSVTPAILDMGRSRGTAAEGPMRCSQRSATAGAGESRASGAIQRALLQVSTE